MMLEGKVPYENKKVDPVAWNKIPYNKNCRGMWMCYKKYTLVITMIIYINHLTCAIIAMCIGLRFYKPEDIDQLIAICIENGRITHNNPVAFLGGLASALFITYVIQKIGIKLIIYSYYCLLNYKDIKQWGKRIYNILPVVLNYLKKVRKRLGKL